MHFVEQDIRVEDVAGWKEKENDVAKHLILKYMRRTDEDSAAEVERADAISEGLTKRSTPHILTTLSSSVLVFEIFVNYGRVNTTQCSSYAAAFEELRWSKAVRIEGGPLLAPFLAADRDGHTSILTAVSTAPLRAQPLAARFVAAYHESEAVRISGGVSIYGVVCYGDEGSSAYLSLHHCKQPPPVLYDTIYCNSPPLAPPPPCDSSKINLDCSDRQ
ncbi:hypothetical protein RB195_019854 [Necator americanus]|uniref:Uncharacterized protein n=1 Tax=Necator americanus TaxID=51031 RepID=A0ABR1CIW0_NECAM